MVSVCRPYDGITLNNEVEYLLDEDEEIIEFEDVEAAKEYLVEHGVDDDYMDILMFVDTETGELIEEEQIIPENA